MATGCLSSPNTPKIPGPRRFRGADLPHRPLAARGRRLHRQDGRRDRHRLVGDPVDPDHRRAGQAPHRVPAHRQLHGPGAQPAARSGLCAARSRRTTPAMRRRAKTMPAGIDFAFNPASAVETDEAERRREFEERWDYGGLGFMGVVRRPAAQRRGERDGGRVRARQDPRDRARSRDSPSCCRRRNVIGCKRLCVDTGYYETFNRPNVTLVDVSDEPIERITADGLRAKGKDYAFDCLVFATGFDAMTGALLQDRHPRPRRPLAAGQVERGAEDLSRPHHGGLPQPVHHHRPGQPVGADQHAAVDRAARRMDRRLHRVPARAAAPR